MRATKQTFFYKKSLSWLLAFYCLQFLQGCGGVPIKDMEFTRSEALWQGLHIVDVRQTYNMATNKDSCHHEHQKGVNSIIGKRPSGEAVVVWGIVIGVAHWMVSENFRQQNDFKPAHTLWQALTTTLKIRTIYNNEQIGMGFNEDTCES